MGILKLVIIVVFFCSLLPEAYAANVTTSNNSGSSRGSGNSGHGSPSITTSNNSSSNLGSRGPSNLTTSNLSSTALGNNTGRGSPTITTSNNTSSRLGSGFGGGPTNAPLPYYYTTPSSSSGGLTHITPHYMNSDAIPDAEQNPNYWRKSDASRPYYIEQLGSH